MSLALTKKDFFIFLITSIPFNFLVSGGIATLIGKQALTEFISVFTYAEIFSFMLVETYEYYIGKKEKKISDKV